MILTPLPEPTFLEQISLMLLAVWVTAFFALPVFLLHSKQAGKVAAVTLALATLGIVSARPSMAVQDTRALVQEEQTPVIVPMVKIPGNPFLLHLFAPDARARLCLKEAFAFPGQITIIVVGEKTVTLKRPPDMVPSGIDFGRLKELRYHTCEVVDGRPTVRVQARPVEYLR